VNADTDGQYQLGDDALEVLRDIKRWIRFYDEKTNRMDVARCLYEANLIQGDLLPILAMWRDASSDTKFKARIALACIEVMVPLTWPMERDRERMTVNHHRHMPVLELAQVAYKRAIINFDGARILHTAVRCALPSMAIPIGDRTARDQGIIKLVLFFLRNIASIMPAPGAQYEGDESQISRSATIDAFSYQDIFHVLLTLASNMGEDFRTEDTTVMEIIYHLVKRVDVKKLFMDERQLQTAKTSELTALMKKEAAMLQSYNRPSRHSRFGTMLWVKRADGKMSTVTGQDALLDSATRNRKLDEAKKFRPPRRSKKETALDREMGLPAKLNPRANDQLRSFTEDFLDSGFNPLFSHVRKTIDREAPHVLQYHRRQFFYLVAWFLEAERARRKSKKSSGKNDGEDVSSFNLVAGVLNQEMFITLNKALHECHENKDWYELTAVMRCFTQILLTVQEMLQSGNNDDEEIAENTLGRLFYEESTHDAIANIVRLYKDQGFDYLDAVTELVHNFLRVLETYSKQNADMQVRSRKRARQKKKTAKEAGGGIEEGAANDDSADDEEAAERVSRERKFDFQRFASRFTPQGVVDTFITFAKFYKDLDEAQLKRAHRFLYRLAFKQDMAVMLFRVDIIQLLHNMVKGPDALDKASPQFKDWEELVKQILRKCFKKIDERPELIIEMLFSKLQSTAFFLEYGHEKQTTATKAQAKPGVELEFKHTNERDHQIAIVVGALLDKNQSDHLAWAKRIITEAESERRSWEAAEEARQSTEDPFGDENEGPAPEPKQPPSIGKIHLIFTSLLSADQKSAVKADDQDRKNAIFKKSHLRLLMTVAGFQRPEPVSEETVESTWIIPENVTANHLKDTLHFINQAEFNPPTFNEGEAAENQLKRKTVPRRKAAFDDDDDGLDGMELDDDILFPAGGPTTRKAIDGEKRKKKTLRRRKKNSDDAEQNELDDEALEEKARKRRDKEREKALRIKSALYVKEGDDEFDSDEDEEFFARERALAARAEQVAKSAGGLAEQLVAPKKRKSEVLLAESDDEEDDDAASLARRVLSSPDAASESETDDTPVDVSDGEGRKRRRVSVDSNDVIVSDGNDLEKMAPEAPSQTRENDDEEEDAPVLTRRPRVRGGFVMDSDDDE
jgi:replication fork protection complex subunit Tof1/Swi1